MDIGCKCGFGIFLIMTSILLSFTMFCIITDKRINKNKNKPIVYFMSKVLTIKNIVKNNHQSQLLYKYDTSGKIELLSADYQSLLKVITKDGCAEGYRQCGILDTIGNILCIDENYDCPINKIKIDLVSKKNDYLNKGFGIGFYPNLIYNYQLYYSNNYPNSNIIISLIRQSNTPKFCTLDNFILDENSYRDEYGNLGNIGVNLKEQLSNKTKTYNGQEMQQNLLSLILEEDKIEKLPQTVISLLTYISNKYFEKFTQYVEERLEKEENNIDKYYENVGESVYAKNYIGFKSIEDIDTFMNFDYSIYK